MPKEPPAGGGSFDLDKLRQLIELMERHDLTEVSLRRGEEQWRLRRGGPQHAAPPPSAAAPAYAPAHAAAPAPASPPAAADAGAGMLEIKSPTVGTFYASPSPDDPPFVKIGSRVQPDTVVCLVEAMKVFNQILAEVSGTIAEVLVNSGDPVDFGQVLFRVRPG
jgi:acetyl-CoA carboxylase biotin carboxyl carrier protein